MKSSLRERVERLGPVRDVVPASSGSREGLILRRPEVLAKTRSIDAMRALVYGGGLTLLKAKRAVEAALDDGEVAVMLPHVPDRDALAKRLADAGFPSAFSTPSEPVEVKRLREGLSLTQEQFAVLYGIDLRTLQGYESGRSKPDQGTAAYLDLIRKAPEETRKLRLSFT